MQSWPEPPDEMSELQKELWNSLAPLVELEAIDWLLYAQAVTALSYALEIEKAIAQDGVVIDFDKPIGGTDTMRIVIPNPMLKDAEKWMKTFSSLTDKLGWSPAARKAVKSIGTSQNEKPKLPDPFSTPPALLQNND